MRKRVLLAMVAIVAAMSTFTSCDKEDIAVTINDLPAIAQTTITEHFNVENVMLITLDEELFGSEYTVLFKDGTTMDLDKNGNWNSIESNSGVPETIIPQAINTYLESNYPDQIVIDIDKETTGYDVSLNNQVELKFNLEGTLIGAEID